MSGGALLGPENSKSISELIDMVLIGYFNYILRVRPIDSKSSENCDSKLILPKVEQLKTYVDYYLTKNVKKKKVIVKLLRKISRTCEEASDCFDSKYFDLTCKPSDNIMISDYYAVK
jgi:hypothetical protein